ncbi:hypothetical protein K438DRAFT_2013835 [Mycena galopus ATCC 62051]|nr:hypothetical protein K438DRAFT_2013835 [Mycena galopus ATCC 62051]
MAINGTNQALVKQNIAEGATGGEFTSPSKWAERKPYVVPSMAIAKLWPDAEENLNRSKAVVKRAHKAPKELKATKDPKAKAASKATARSTTKAKPKPKRKAEESEEEDDADDADEARETTRRKRITTRRRPAGRQQR